MHDPVAILKALREKKVALLQECQAEIERLQVEIREISGQIDGIDESIKALSPLIPPSVPPSTAANLYEKATLTEAILSVIESNGTAPGLFVPEIITFLIQGGFKSDAKQIYASVYSVSMGLVKQEKIKESQKNGRRSFMRKQPF